MRRHVGLRSGFALPVAVGATLILAIVVFSVLFFSSSQTSSLKGSIDRWRARSFAMAGLKLAGEKLRQERWYGDEYLMGILEPASAGLDPTKVSFTVVCEDSRRLISNVTVGGTAYEQYALLDHIDIFSRGESGDKTHVAFGRFILSPEPGLEGKSTEGLLRSRDGGSLIPAPFTLKRLVRISDFREPSLSEIDQLTVRNAIRERYAASSTAFTTNYALIDWAARPTAPTNDRMNDGQADSFLRRFMLAEPGAGDRLFINHRLFDFVIEGTSADDRLRSGEQRTINLELDPPSDRKAFIIAACEACGVEVEDPAEDRIETFEEPRAMPDLHDEREADPGEGGYVHSVCYLDKAQVVYSVEWTSTRSSEAVCGGPYAEESPGVWRDGLTVTGPTWITKPYWLTDGATNSEMRMDDLTDFFTKYFGDAGEPVGDYFKNESNIGSVPVGQGTTGTGTGGGGGNPGSGGNTTGGW